MRGIPISATEEELKTFKEAHDMVRKGFAGTMDQLADYLSRV